MSRAAEVRATLDDRPWIKRKLIHDLAIGEKDQKTLAGLYGVSPAAISAFKGRYRPDIEAARDNLNDKLANLWITKQENRLAAYQAEYERALQQMAKDGFDAQTSRAAQAALRAVAEELGALKLSVSAHLKVNYSIEGVDMDRLT